MNKRSNSTPKTSARKPQNKVWIELPVPRDAEHGKEISDLANNLLVRLNDGEPVERLFWWSEHENRYCYGGNMGFIVCSDFGEWFNLDYLGREIGMTGDAWLVRQAAKDAA